MTNCNKIVEFSQQRLELSKYILSIDITPPEAISPLFTTLDTSDLDVFK